MMRTPNESLDGCDVDLASADRLIESLRQQLSVLRLDRDEWKEAHDVVVANSKASDEQHYKDMEGYAAALAEKCTSPWDDSPPCRGIQKVLDQLSAALAACKVKDEALQYLHEEKCDYMRLNHLGNPVHETSYRLAVAALAIQPDDSALKAWLGEPVGIIEFGGFWLNENNEVKVQDGTPLYSPKGKK